MTVERPTGADEARLRAAVKRAAKDENQMRLYDYVVEPEPPACALEPIPRNEHSKPPITPKEGKQ